MRSRFRNGKISIGSLVGAIVLLGFAVLAAWKFTSVKHTSHGASERSFVLNIDFDKFRKIMVRKNATAAIVGHSGMQLIEEQIADLEIDTSHDDRPILNALRGKSKSELSATKQIMVRLDDPELDADRLSLTQNANVQPELMQVRTTSNQPTGKLEHYETTLDAKPSNEGTAVTVTVDMRVQVKVPKLFTGQADKRVRSAANKATDEQESAIRAFISDHAKELIVLPEL